MSTQERTPPDFLSIQEAPRTLHLMPEELLVPAPAVKAMLGAGPLQLRYTGYAFAPFVNNGDLIKLSRAKSFHKGQLVLVDAGGWLDMRRVLAEEAEEFRTGIDAFPHASELISPTQIVGLVHTKRKWVEAMAELFVPRIKLLGRLAQLAHRGRRIAQGVRFDDDAQESVLQKYDDQIDAYSSLSRFGIDHSKIDLCQPFLHENARVLVVGCGTGSEAIALATAGYEVHAFDLLPGMLEAARANAEDAGVSVHFYQEDFLRLENTSGPFDFIYVTALLYSFVKGAEHRVAFLRSLGRHGAPDVSLMFSAKVKTPRLLLDPTIAWALRRFSGRPLELGDWYTWYLSSTGSIERSFSHSFASARQVTREAQRAGFATVRRIRGQFVASAFNGEA